MQLTRVALLAALVVGLMASPALAVNITWSSGGTMGFDPFGHLWDADNNQANGDGLWGIPGLFAGNQTWQAPDFIASLKVTFFNLPPTVAIDPLPPPPAVESTQLFNATDGENWTRIISGGNSVLFLATPTSILDPGDEFIINVAFDAPIDVNALTFDVTYSMIPEPSAVVLLGTGLFGLAAVAARRRRA